MGDHWGLDSSLDCWGISVIFCLYTAFVLMAVLSAASVKDRQRQRRPSETTNVEDNDNVESKIRLAQIMTGSRLC